MSYSQPTGAPSFSPINCWCERYRENDGVISLLHINHGASSCPRRAANSSNYTSGTAPHVKGFLMLSLALAVCEGLTVQVGWILMPLTQRTRRRLALAQGPALPGPSQTPRSLRHTSHIKRKQVTQMRQMVLVCDDSCNSFSPSPPNLFFPLGFLLVSLTFFSRGGAGVITLKQPRCAT